LGWATLANQRVSQRARKKKRRGKFRPRLFAVRPELFAAAIYSAAVGSRSFFGLAQPERVKKIS
jgi:hypothetical protein